MSLATTRLRYRTYSVMRTAFWTALTVLAHPGVVHVRGGRVKGAVAVRPFWFGSSQLRVVIERHAFLDRNVQLQGTGYVHIGPRSFIGPNSVVSSNASVRIGADVQIASGVSIRDSDHAVTDGVVEKTQVVSEPVRIEDGAWIGSNVVILKGVTIGSGAVVGAGAVVTRSVEPGVTVVGNPARPIQR